MQKRKVPFYGNKADDMHCYQASLKMVLKYFFPTKNFSWKQLEDMTGMKKGKWTWNTKSILELHKMGFSIVDMALFDAKSFIEQGKDYLYEIFGQEAGEAQVRFSDIPHEQRLMKKYVKLNIWQNVSPTMRDIKRLLDDGYLIICSVNGRKLNGLKGYSGHAVLIYGYENKKIVLHNPGLPPEEAKHVTVDRFKEAWEYPTKHSRNLLAIKLP
jgi:hypothetical protein